MTAYRRNPIVFAVQESPGKDLLPAEEFGEVQFLLNPLDQLWRNVPRLVEVLMRSLADFQDGDFILPIGDPAAIGVVCALVAGINDGRFTILKWDRHSSRYTPVEIILPGAPGGSLYVHFKG